MILPLKKAKTAKYFDCWTHDLGKKTMPGQELYLIELTGDGLVSFGGGAPLKDQSGKIIGAIGISGGRVDEDMVVAKAGVSSLY